MVFKTVLIEFNMIVNPLGKLMKLILYQKTRGCVCYTCVAGQLKVMKNYGQMPGSADVGSFLTVCVQLICVV